MDQQQRGLMSRAVQLECIHHRDFVSATDWTGETGFAKDDLHVYGSVVLRFCLTLTQEET
jgi:hypothetical protein